MKCLVDYLQCLNDKGIFPRVQSLMSKNMILYLQLMLLWSMCKALSLNLPYSFMAWCLLIGTALPSTIRPLPLERIAIAPCSAYGMYHFGHVTFFICYCRFLVCAICWRFRIYIQGWTLITKFTIHFPKIPGHYRICLAISLDLALSHLHFNTGHKMQIILTV